MSYSQGPSRIPKSDKDGKFLKNRTTRRKTPDSSTEKALPAIPTSKYAPDESYMNWTSDEETTFALGRVKQSMRAMKLNVRRYAQPCPPQVDWKYRISDRNQNATPRRLPPKARPKPTISVNPEKHVVQEKHLTTSTGTTTTSKSRSRKEPFYEGPDLTTTGPAPLGNSSNLSVNSLAPVNESSAAQQTRPVLSHLSSSQTHPQYHGHGHTRSRDFQSTQRASYDENSAIKSTYASLHTLADRSHPSQLVSQPPLSICSPSTQYADPVPSPSSRPRANIHTLAPLATKTTATVPIRTNVHPSPPSRNLLHRHLPIDSDYSSCISAIASAFPANEAQEFVAPDTPSSCTTERSTSRLRPHKLKRLFQSLRQKTSSTSMRRVSA